LIVGVCKRALVLNFGRTLVEGPPAEVLKDRRVIEAYSASATARDQQPHPLSPQAGEGNSDELPVQVDELTAGTA